MRTRGGFADVDKVTISKIRCLAIDLDELWRVVHSGWRAQYGTAIHRLIKLREFLSLEELVLVRYLDSFIIERWSWPGLVFEERESVGKDKGQGFQGNEFFIQATIQSDIEREAKKYPGWKVPLVRIVDARKAELDG